MAASTVLRSAFDVESFINEYYGAWAGADEDRIMSYYADNVVLQIPGVIMEGKGSRPRSVRSAIYHGVPGKPPPREEHDSRTRRGHR